ADRNRSHWSTSKTPSYTKSVSWQHHPIRFLVIASFVVAISYRLFVASNDEMNPLAIIAHSIATIVRRFEKP
ncbi:hypothetical protein LOK69_03485, partial [Escherichia coli]|uniref:hypothetical protein n=1 Tax=Escherichia coli TaxID=562 RepID=UPI001E5CA9D9